MQVRKIEWIRSNLNDEASKVPLQPVYIMTSNNPKSILPHLSIIISKLNNLNSVLLTSEDGDESVFVPGDALPQFKRIRRRRSKAVDSVVEHGKGTLKEGEAGKNQENDDVLDILLWPVPTGPEDNLEKISKIIAKHFAIPETVSFKVDIANLPVSLGTSEDEYKVRRTFWPPSRKPVFPVDIIATNEEERSSLINHVLKDLCKDAIPPEIHNCFENRAILVDPETDQVILQSGDKDISPQHPIKGHCAFAIIEEMAKHQLKLPEDRFDNPLNPENSYLLRGFDFYTVLEPCIMCSMALLHSRIRRCIFLQRGDQIVDLGARKKFMGGIASTFRLHTLEGVNHRFEVYQVHLEK